MKEKISKSDYDEDNKIAEISYYKNLKRGFERVRPQFYDRLKKQMDNILIF